MGMDWTSCAVREIKRKLIWRQQQLQHCSTGQRHFLPSSVIICMLVPQLLSWLNEITGSFLPGFANGARQALRKNSYWSMSTRDQKKKKKHSVKTQLLAWLIKCWQLLIAEIIISVYNDLTGKKKHATVQLTYQSHTNTQQQTYLAPLWWGYLLQLWQTSASLIHGQGCFQEKIYPSQVVWSLNAHKTHNMKHMHLMQYSILYQRLQTGTSAELIHWGYFIHSRLLPKHKVAECDVTVFLTRSNISQYIINVTHSSFCFP